MFGEATDKWIKLSDDVIKLMQSTQQLRQSLRSKQKVGVSQGIQDISFWVSKIMTSLPAAEDSESHLSMYKKAMAAIFEAQKIANDAKNSPGISITNPRKPKPDTNFGAATLGSMMSTLPLDATFSVYFCCRRWTASFICGKTDRAELVIPCSLCYGCRINSF
jgi:hypothetical protein